MGLSHRASEYGRFLSDEQIAATTTPATLTVPATSTGVVSALISAVDGNILVRYNGAPTASVGHKVSSGGHMEVFGHTDLTNLQLRSDAGTVNVHVSYFKE